MNNRTNKRTDHSPYMVPSTSTYVNVRQRKQAAVVSTTGQDETMNDDNDTPRHGYFCERTNEEGTNDSCEHKYDEETDKQQTTNNRQRCVYRLTERAEYPAVRSEKRGGVANQCERLLDVGVEI